MSPLALLALWLLAALAFAEPVRRVRRDDGPLVPTMDSFYLPPPDWLKAKPGAVLKWRNIKPGFTQVNDMNVKDAYQILYRSHGIDESVPMATVTTVLVPHKPRPHKLVMMMPYQDSNYIGCAPSYIIQQGAPMQNNSIQSLEQLMWTSILNDGWIMTVPDHQGPNSSFAVGPMSGRASLDAARATLDFKKLGLKHSDSVVGTGYSGGAIAAGWAAQLQSTYASDLNVAGWAIGGTPANMTDTLYTMDGGLFAGLSIAGLAGIVNSYGQANDYVGSVISRQGNVALQYTRENCMSDIIINLRNVKVLNRDFVSNGRKLLVSDRITPLLETISMARDKKLTPKAPIYMYHSKNDEVISYPSALKTAHNWCDNGANVHFETFFGMEMAHVSTEVLNTPNVLSFIRNRMDGKDFGGCKFTNTANPLWSPDILGAKLTETLNAVKDFWGNIIGRGDDTLKERIRSGKAV